MDGNMKKVTSGNVEVYRQLQGLDQLNVMKILSCEEKDGCFWIEEEVFESQTMEDVLQEEEITADTFFDWILQICDALEYLYEANPPITGVSLRTEDILIGDDNVLKLVGFSEATNAVPVDDALAKDIAGVMGIMNSVNREFMRKYDSLINEWEDGREFSGILDFRKEFIEAYTARLGMKRVVLIGAVVMIMMVLRLFRKLF